MSLLYVLQRYLQTILSSEDLDRKSFFLISMAISLKVCPPKSASRLETHTNEAKIHKYTLILNNKKCRVHAGTLVLK